MHPGDFITLTRDCVATQIPSGVPHPLSRGSQVRLMQSLGGSYTVMTDQGYMVRLDPKDPINHFLLGKALAKKRNLEACIAELRDAVRLRPDFAEAHDALGSALEQKKDLRSALAQYQIAHGLEPHNLNYRFHYEHLSHALGH